MTTADRVIELVDKQLVRYAHQSMLPTSELRDILLDIRLECTMIPEHGGTDGELQERARALARAGDSGQS